MNPELKTKWLEALRSGNYKQGHGTLHKNDTYCCLGVLCEVAALGWDDGGDGYFLVSGTSSQDYLPSSFALDADMSDDDQQELTDMNDSGDSFEEIADYIEEHL